MTTAVVGAGLSGLVRAHALSKAGEEVVVFEGAEEPGGVVRSERVDGFLLELGPNTVRRTPEIASLVEELGLSSAVLLADSRLPRFIEFRGRLHGLRLGPFILATPLLSLRGKLRALGEPLVRSRSRGTESAAEFFERRLGREVAERLIAPFVSGVWAGDAAQLSAAEAFPTAVRWEAEHGSLLRGALAARRAARTSSTGLLSFRDGLQVLPLGLAAALGPRLNVRCPVRRITPLDSGGWRIDTDRGARDASRVVLATPARETARLLEPFEPEAAAALEEIPHPPLAVLHLAVRREAASAPLAGFGHLVVPDPTGHRRILGAVWSSCLFADRAPEGQVLFTVFAGGTRDPGIVSLPDDALARVAARDLSEALHLTEPPRLVLATRYPRALPQYGLRHAFRMAALDGAERRRPGLVLLGSYRGGVSVGDVIRNAANPARIYRTT